MSSRKGRAGMFFRCCEIATGLRRCVLSIAGASRWVLGIVLLCAAILTPTASAEAQNIRGRYVAKVESDGTIYHTFPETLFGSRECGDVTFDVTYKDRADQRATINFTYSQQQMAPADSVRFTVGGKVVMGGPVKKLYIEPGRKEWTHRYSFTTPVGPLYSFFDEATAPVLTIYSGGKGYVYPAKRSAWRDYAPIGFRIFEMIRVNEQR